jgi:hypothetical protein
MWVYRIIDTPTSSVSLAWEIDSYSDDQKIPSLIKYFLFNPLKTKCVLHKIYKNSVRTSQETRYVSTTKPNLLILFREQPRFTARTIRNTQIHYVRRMGCCNVLKHVENIITTRSKGLINATGASLYTTSGTAEFTEHERAYSHELEGMSTFGICFPWNIFFFILLLKRN